MSDQPMSGRVGILIPTYNRVGLLAESLESARAQSHRHIEIIVIDNGSGDGTADYMRAVHDDRVRYVVNEENIGLSGSINKGVGMFSDEVEWCSVLSDDDLLDKDFVKFALRCATACSAKAIVDGHRIFIDDNGATMRVARSSPETESAVGYLRSRTLFLRDTYLTGILFNRKSFAEVGGYPVFTTGMGSDDAFIFSLAMKDRLCHARGAVAYVRIHEKAESQRASDALPHMRSVNEYRQYVLSALTDSGQFDADTVRRVSRLIDLFVSCTYDALWIRKTRVLPSENETVMESDRRDIEELLSAVERNEFPFTGRVRMDAFFLTRSGIDMESSFPYRAFWEAWKSMRLLYHKFVSSRLAS